MDTVIIHAKFGRRLLAGIIDFFVLLFPFCIALYVSAILKLANINMTIFVIILCSIIAISYYSILESSSWQATIGKKILKLRVTNLKYEKLSTAHAITRSLAKGISPLIAFCFMQGVIFLLLFTVNNSSFLDVMFRVIFFISFSIILFDFLLILFTKNKQSFYDMCSKTCVINK